MIKKNKPIEIDENDIFSNDKLKRKQAIQNLSSMISSTTEAFTLCIDADWGAGKTTFVKLWQAYLKKEYEIKSIYFSAWEDDFSKEPLISILGEINNYILDNFSNNDELTKKFEKLTEVGAKLLKRGLPTLLKIATSGFVDIKDENINEALGELAENSTKELIHNYPTDKKITEEFKNSIKELLSKLDNEKPFVIFIDELDRCRPTYAIELLERIKHIFGIDGLIFVLSIDKKQLSESIKSHYGNIDSNSYLKRFIDMEYQLHNPSIDGFCEYLYERNKILDIRNKKQHLYSGNEDSSLIMLKFLSKSIPLSLREIEQVFIKLSIIFKTVKPGFLNANFEIAVLLIVLRIKFPQQYELLINQEIEAEKVIELLTNKFDDLSDSLRIAKAIIKAVVLSVKKTEQELNQIIAEKKDELKKFKSEASKNDEVKVKIEDLEKLILLLDYKHGGFTQTKFIHLTETVIKKIEFTDEFNLEEIK